MKAAKLAELLLPLTKSRISLGEEEGKTTQGRQCKKGMLPFVCVHVCVCTRYIEYSWVT